MSAVRHSIFAALVLIGTIAAGGAYAEERLWSVSRSSGEVWVATPGAQQAALSSEIKPGDTIRTGRNGRVLLVRREESILISPNSSIAVPKNAGDGMSTTILQQAGSILLDVEKRNVKHFEVQTPLLAAVVKGTQFRISVSATGTSVNVTRGQVEVAHFKTGQIAQIMPGQTATSSAHGKVGLSLSGSGNFSPIEQGKPRPSPVERLSVPKGGLAPPRQANNGAKVRSIAQLKSGVAAPVARHAKTTQASARAGIRISAPIGDVRLNFSKVTQGMARSHGSAVGNNRTTASTETTIWSSEKGSGGASNGLGNAARVAATAAASISASERNPGNSGNRANNNGDRGKDNGNGANNGNNGNRGNNGNNGNRGNNGNGGNGNNGKATGAVGNSGNGNSGNGNAGNGNAGNGNAGNGNTGNTNSGNGGPPNNGGGNGNSGQANGNGNSGNSGKGNGKT